MPPSHADFKKLARRVVRLVAVSSPESMALFAARRGFPDAIVDDLRSIYTEVKAPPPRPVRKADYLAAILKHLDPTVTDAQVAEAVAASTGVDEAPVICSGLHVEDLLEELDSDGDELAAIRASQALERARLQRAARERAQVRLDAVDPPAPPPVELITVETPVKWTQRIAKTYLPPGCKISMHVVGGSRWQVTAPAYLPKDRSRAFDRHDEGSVRAALLFVLRVAWAAYTYHTGGQCSFDLSAGADA